MLYDLDKYKKSKKSKADLDHLVNMINKCCNDLIRYIDKEDICRLISIMQGYGHKFELELHDLEYKIDDATEQ